MKFDYLRYGTLLAIMFTTISCTKRSDATVVLVSTTIFGSPVHIASFDGNSANQSGDCQVTAAALNEKYSRNYECKTWREVKDEIK